MYIVVLVVQFIILALVIICPIGWFISEFRATRQIRLLLGVLSIAIALCVSFVLGYLKRYEYNASFGQATHSLIEISIKGIEQGKTEAILNKWKLLSAEYRPTYRSKAQYDELVKRYVSEIEHDIR